MEKLLEILAPFLDEEDENIRCDTPKKEELPNLPLPLPAKDPDTLSEELFWNSPIHFREEKIDPDGPKLPSQEIRDISPKEAEISSVKKEFEIKDERPLNTTTNIPKPKWIIIRKFGKRGGVKILVPPSIEKLLELGGERLGINPIKVREVKSEAEIDHIRALKEDDIVWLMTSEDELHFS